MRNFQKKGHHSAPHLFEIGITLEGERIKTCFFLNDCEHNKEIALGVSLLLFACENYFITKSIVFENSKILYVKGPRCC